MAEQLSVGSDSAGTINRANLELCVMHREHGVDGVQCPAPERRNQWQHMPAAFDLQTIKIKTSIVDFGIFVDRQTAAVVASVADRNLPRLRGAASGAGWRDPQ